MDQPRQEQFVNELVENIRRDVVRQIMTGRIPSEWDGHELRQLLADRFTQSASLSDDMRNKRSKRRRDYENTVIVNNL